jgi:hypothetical protein
MPAGAGTFKFGSERQLLPALEAESRSDRQQKMFQPIQVNPTTSSQFE